jgi:hypothetical protein
VPAPKDKGLKKKKKGAERKALLLRLSPAVHDELRKWAAQDMRSLNAQIEFLLRESLRRRKGGSAE